MTLYTTPLSSLIHSHKLDHHLYADDTQVYISLSTADTDISLKQLDDCLRDISGWMTNNKHNIFHHYRYIQTTQQTITPSDTVRNLGVTFDSDFNFRKHLSLSCRSSFYHIRGLRRIRRCISFIRQSPCYCIHY